MLITDPIGAFIDPLTGDIPATGNVPTTSGIAGVLQAARIRLKMIRGECFLNLDQGVPYYERAGVPASQALMGQKFNKLKAIRAVRDALLGTATTSGVPALVEILALDAEYDGKSRTLTVTWQGRCLFGDLPVDIIKAGA